MSTLGWVHLTFGAVALLAGTAVVLLRKGTRWHRTMGHVYLTNMVALNVSALFIYRLFGRFGHPQCFGGGVGQRGFAKHMLAGGQGLGDVLFVSVGGQAHQHKLCLRIIEELPMVGGSPASQGRSLSLRLFRRPSPDPGQLCPRNLFQPLSVLKTDPRTQNGDIHDDLPSV